MTAPPKHKRRIRTRGKSSSAKGQGSKDDDDDDEDLDDEAQPEDKEFRNSDIVGSYAFAYGNESTVAATKEIKRFEKLMKFAPKYRKTESKEGGEGKEEKNEDDDAARKVNATMVAEVEASLHKLDSKGDD